MEKIICATGVLLMAFLVVPTGGGLQALSIGIAAEAAGGTEVPESLLPGLRPWSTGFRGRLQHEPAADGFLFAMDISFLNDGVVESSQDSYYGGFYFQLNEGGVGYRLGGLQARAGRFLHSDAVDSPYALFINSREIPAFQYELLYDGGFFTAESRAVELNRQSEHGFPDRGMVYKRFALNLGSWEIGYQDSIVSVDPAIQWAGDAPADNDGDNGGVQWRRPPEGDGRGMYFVPEYFFSPIPSFLLQYVLGSGEKPWLIEQNHTSIMGFYVNRRSELWELQAQWLVDDINMNRLLNPDGRQNPDKMGWMVGGRVKTDFGRFGLWHAGAHRYTFQPYGTSSTNTLNRMYGYTYYPDVEFPRGSGMQAISRRDNNIGLYLGENSAGFRLDWDHGLDVDWGAPAVLDLRGGLEFTLTGSQSPANPWGEYEHWQQHEREGTRFLDDDVLEKALLADVGVSWSPRLERGAGDVRVDADVQFGGLWNVLQLEQPRGVEVTPDGDVKNPANAIRIWYPSDDHAGLAGISLSIRYYFSEIPFLGLHSGTVGE